MPDFHADCGANDQKWFSSSHSQEFPETLWDQQPSASHQLQVTVSAGEQPAKLLKIVDLLFQFSRFQLVAYPVESLGHLLLPGVVFPETESTRAFLDKHNMVAQVCRQLLRDREAVPFVEGPPELAQQQVRIGIV